MLAVRSSVSVPLVVYQRPKTLNYNLLVPVLHNLRVTLEMIKWEHSIFALPFALCGAMLAAGGFPSSANSCGSWSPW